MTNSFPPMDFSAAGTVSENAVLHDGTWAELSRGSFRFTGEDGSLGYRKGRDYDLVLAMPGERGHAVQIVAGGEPCPYSSVASFERNWERVADKTSVERLLKDRCSFAWGESEEHSGPHMCGLQPGHEGQHECIGPTCHAYRPADNEGKD